MEEGGKAATMQKVDAAPVCGAADENKCSLYKSDCRLSPLTTIYQDYTTYDAGNYFFIGSTLRFLYSILFISPSLSLSLSLSLFLSLSLSLAFSTYNIL